MHLHEYVDQENRGHLETLSREKIEEFALHHPDVSSGDRLVREIYAVIEPDRWGGHAIYRVECDSHAGINTPPGTKKVCATLDPAVGTVIVYPSLDTGTSRKVYTRSSAGGPSGLFPETIDVLIRLECIIIAFDRLDGNTPYTDKPVRPYRRPDKIFLGRDWVATKVDSIVNSIESYAVEEGLDVSVEPVAIIPIRRELFHHYVLDPFLGSIYDRGI